EDNLSAFWKPQFTLPENGPEGLEESCYYADVQGVRFISLNSNLIEESEEFYAKQKAWLEERLENNPNRWTCVLLHHPFYSTKGNRDNPWLRKEFKPLMDNYNVDLVLQGHDHAYARGMERIPAGENEKPGTMYVVSVSGPKMYESERKDWMDNIAGNKQLYQLITIDGKRLSYEAYTSSGELYDAFDLVKRKGKPNKVINRIPL
ncbi:MAG TPA: metallophosphoesterase, partial [Anseongella sp.]|nr:metallophosphoesterase [Anseongella sp.]